MGDDRDEATVGSPSPVPVGRRAPDLLFEDEQQERVAELGLLLGAPETLTPATPLHRVTVFLTYRCNLSCPYCKTIARDARDLARAPQKGRAFDLAAFDALLSAHAGTPVRHLHYTGGEAALVPQLAAMVRLAKARGVEAQSLTSNGTLPATHYLELAAAGLDELRVSLDAPDARLGAALTRRSTAFAATTRTLAALAAARRAGARLTLILNAVVGLENRARLPELVRFLLRFEPDDVKLITEVDRKGELGDFPSAEAVRAGLEALVSELPVGALPLLRRKLATVFARDAIGLPGAGAGEAPWRCFVPLTERTVDRDFYYPCSVYLREGGSPLGPLTDGPAVQRARSASFVRDADCQADPLCRRYCLHCTRTFNDRANGARR